jgi:hypothetical protein
MERAIMERGSLLPGTERLVSPHLPPPPSPARVQVAKDTVATPGIPEPHLERIARDITQQVAAQVLPPVDDVRRRTLIAETQRVATSEHRSLMDEVTFRREVLRRLADISARLPVNHPAREKIVRVIMGRRR